MDEKPIVNTEIQKECKFVTHVPKYGYRPDIHYIKEKIVHPDGRVEKNLRMVKNFKRPFYVLKEHFRNYKQKKESEPLDRLNKYFATESDLLEETGKVLGQQYIGKNNVRFVKDNPYVYGLDLTSSTFIKKAYFDKYKLFTSFDLCVLDIEKEIDGDKRVTVISISMKDKTYTVINSKWLPDTAETRERLKRAYDKYIPQVDYMENVVDVTEFYSTEIDMVKAIFKKLHEWKPDIVEVWNITYDLKHIIDIIEKAGERPEDIFNDPIVPKEYRYFKFKIGKMSRVTEKGVHKGLDFHEQWHTVISPATFYFVDGASVYHYVRQGGKKVPTGYGLDSILNFELGEEFRKIHIEDGIAEKLDKIAWHIYMSNKRKEIYVIYNKYDTRGPILLDNKTKDIQSTMPLLSSYSPFSMFDSNPSRIVEALYFFYLERGEVLGTAPNTKDDDKRLGLGDWIVMLPSTRVKGNGMRFLSESNIIETSFRGNTFDADQSAGYPSDGQVSNASKDTTMRELLKVEGIAKSDFKKQNINLFFGPVNHLEYAQQMFNFPSVFDIDKGVEKYLPTLKNRHVEEKENLAA